ncbi:MAG: Coenzyme F420 hydrogenase/dehydrogenase, beta subunit C-terminal domain, partial [Myxococcota bacterium]
MASGIDLPTIVDSGLCTGCGLCESLAGADRVEMVLTAEGRIRPRVKGGVPEPILESIRQVCPGIGIRGPGSGEGESPSTLHPIFGPIRRIFRGWAKDDEVRYRSAAGGVMTALGVYLLESREVDAVLHVRASDRDPVLTQAFVSRTADEVQNAAGSRYGPAAPLRLVHRMLNEGARIAVMAKPCDVAAVAQLCRVDRQVSEQVAYLITFFCGGVPSSETARKIVRYHGLSRDDVSEFRFRGHGWPGPTSVVDREGRSFELSYEDTWFNENVPWRYDMQFRCKICADAVGESGDLACPDAWLMKDGKPIHQEAPGANLMIARTERGE